MSDLMATRSIDIQNMPEVITVIPRNMDQNPAFVYLASLSAKSGRVTQQQVLGVIAGWLGGTIDTVEWGSLRYAHTVAIKTRIIEAGYAPASTRKILCALRGTLKAAWKLGQINAEELAKATDWGKVTGTSLPAGRFVLDDEIAKLFQACLADKPLIGARDAAIIALLYGCGLRRAEIVDLDLKDYNAEAGTLVVHGKRGKEREAYVVNGTSEALHAWLAVRSNVYGPMFLAVSKMGRIRHGVRLSNQTVYNIISQRLKEAGLEKFSPHSLRRSYCSKLLDAGVDISTVSKMAGHTNIQTTAIYDRRPAEAQRAGAELLRIPYPNGDTIPQENG